MTEAPVAISTADVFAKAAAICAAGWTQGTWARDRHGAKVNGSGFTATCWCAGDAIFQAVRQLGGNEAHPVVRAAILALNDHVGEPIQRWNDKPGQTQAEVVKTLRALGRPE